MGQIFPYVLPLRERQTVVLAWHPDHIGGPARSTNIKPIFDAPRLAAILPFFMRGGAPAAHGPLVAKSSEPASDRIRGHLSFHEQSRRPAMSMKPQPIPEIPLETVRVVRAAFPTDAESLVASQTAYRVDPVGLTAKDYRWQA